MALIGLSKPYAAVYANTGSTVTYSSGAVCGKAVALDVSLEDGSDNILYADDAPAESDNQFAGGTLTLTTDDLYADVMASFLGMEEAAVSGTGLPAGAKWYKNNENQVTPDLGFGAIAKKKVGGAIKYVAIVFQKIQFANLSQSIETQGETINWQTPEITAQIMRSDNATHDWRWISSDLDTEADAEALIKNVLNIE